MARTIRHRARSHVITGTIVTTNNVGGTSSSVTSNTYLSSCDDSVGRPVVASPLTLEERLDGIVANGGVSGSTGLIRRIDLTNVPLLFGSGDVNDLNSLAIPAGWELALIARTNPSRPILFFPELVQDIVDLPKMLKNLLDFLGHPHTAMSARGAANGYLGVQFGWIPLIEDFQKLSKTNDYVQRRTLDILNLYTGEGLRKRVTLASDTKAYSNFQLFTVSAGSTKLFACTEVRKDMWATVRWKPTDPSFLSRLSNQDAGKFLRKVVLGLTPEGMVSGLWKILPWTWLIGWFTNLGDVLLTHSNTIPASPHEACLMRSLTQDRSYSGHTETGPVSNSISVSGAYTFTQKLRTVGSGVLTPSASMPFLDMFRLSVLGSLAIQRIRW